MKNNLVDKDVEELEFQRLTICLNPPGALKSTSPINPEAVLLAVKGQTDDKGPVRHLLAALKSALLGDPVDVARKDDGDSTLDSSAAPDQSKLDSSGDDDAATGDGAVTKAKNAGVASALFQHTADLHNKLADIHQNPQLADGDKKAQMADAIAEHATKTTALASAMYAKKATDALARKAGARHSKADLADLQAAHDGLTASHKTIGASIDKMKMAQDAVGQAHAHTDSLMGSCPDDDASGPDAEDGASASKARQQSEEDDMTPENLTALTEAMKAAVTAGVTAAFKANTATLAASAATIEPLDSTALATTIAEAVKADIIALDAKLDTKISALEASIATKVEEAQKAAEDAGKPELERLSQAAKNAEATAAAATEAAQKANQLVLDAVKSSRDRDAKGGHETEMEAAKARAGKPADPKEKLKGIPDGPQHSVDRIHALLHA